MPNVSNENHLIFMRMIFIPIVSLKDSFCHRDKSKLGIGLFIHELSQGDFDLLLFGAVIQLCLKDRNLRCLQASSTLYLTIIVLTASWR